MTTLSKMLEKHIDARHMHSHSTANPLFRIKLRNYDPEYLISLIDCDPFDKNRILFMINTYREFDTERMSQIEDLFRSKYNYLAVPSFMHNSWMSIRRSKGLSEY